MEFADAGDLSVLIKRQKQELKQLLPECDILSWLVQIAFGLQYIHKKNILHRDLKTQNIFVTSKKLIKIGDFGISKSLSHTLDLATTAIGTPHYLSPEICRRQPYNHKSDMWSLGCVLYELCALQLAFPAENFMALIQSICRSLALVSLLGSTVVTIYLVSVCMPLSQGRAPSAPCPVLAQDDRPGPGGQSTSRKSSLSLKWLMVYYSLEKESPLPGVAAACP